MTHEEEKNRNLHLKRMGLNFKKARLAYEDKRYPNQVPGVVTLVVPDKEGNNQNYVCFEHEVPKDARHLLKAGTHFEEEENPE